MKMIVMIALAMMIAAPMAQATYFLHEDFENYQGGWTHSGYNSLWHIEDYRSNSGEWCAAYNQRPATGAPPNYDIGMSFGTMMTPVMDLSSATEVHFQFASWLQTENAPNEFDVAHVGYSTAPIFGWHYLPPDIQTFEQGQWNLLGADLTSVLAGEAHAQICFTFDTVDNMFNTYEGWYVDDVMVHDGNGTPPPIPEPSTLLLLGSGLIGLGAVTRRRFRK